MAFVPVKSVDNPFVTPGRVKVIEANTTINQVSGPVEQISTINQVGGHVEHMSTIFHLGFHYFT